MRTALFAAAALALTAGTVQAASWEYTVTSGAATFTIDPLSSAGSIASYYNYFSSEAHPGFALTPHKMHVFLHEDTTTGVLGLGMILNTNTSGTAGDLEFDLSGAPAGAAPAVSDDPGEASATPNGFYDFSWSSAFTDGFAIDGLEGMAWTIILSLNGLQSGLEEAGVMHDSGGAAVSTPVSLLAANDLIISAQLVETEVPVPAALPLLAAGLAGFGLVARRRA